MRYLVSMMIVTWLVLFSAAGNAHADMAATPQATVNVVPGALSISSTGNIGVPPITLHGEDYDLVSNSVPTFTMIDARGSGAGWNVTFECTDFSDGYGNTIPASNFKFTSGGYIEKLTGREVDFDGGPFEIGTLNASLEIQRKVLSTSPGFGMGKYQYTPDIQSFILTVPASAMAGEYAATLTATITNGP